MLSLQIAPDDLKKKFYFYLLKIKEKTENNKIHMKKCEKI